MTHFYGFPKANTGVMPECAKTYFVTVIYRYAILSKGIEISPKFSGSPYVMYDERVWSFRDPEDPSEIVAYIPTDIPLEAL